MQKVLSKTEKKQLKKLGYCPHKVQQITQLSPQVRETALSLSLSLSFYLCSRCAKALRVQLRVYWVSIHGFHHALQGSKPAAQTHLHQRQILPKLCITSLFTFLPDQPRQAFG